MPEYLTRSNKTQKFEEFSQTIIDFVKFFRGLQDKKDRANLITKIVKYIIENIHILNVNNTYKRFYKIIDNKMEEFLNHSENSVDLSEMKKYCLKLKKLVQLHNI
jgi:hypothetical protein